MCYKIKVSKSAEELQERFDAVIRGQDELDFVPMEEVNGFAHPKHPVILNSDTGTIQMLNWGLIPPESPNGEFFKGTLNARIETLSEVKSFRTSLHRRCLILADGFYESVDVSVGGKKKSEHQLVHLPDHGLFAMAGLWSEWQGNGETKRTFTLIMTAATGIMTTVHDRMPVLLTPGNEMNWLRGITRGDIRKDIIITPINPLPRDGSLF